MMKKPEIIDWNHSAWEKMIENLAHRLDIFICNHDFEILNDEFDEMEVMGFNIDRAGTIDFLKEHGGFCDCEILLNALPEYVIEKKS